MTVVTKCVIPNNLVPTICKYQIKSSKKYFFFVFDSFHKRTFFSIVLFFYFILIFQISTHHSFTFVQFTHLITNHKMITNETNAIFLFHIFLILLNNNNNWNRCSIYSTKRRKGLNSLINCTLFYQETHRCHHLHFRQ
jgi:hypothetical protein